MFSSLRFKGTLIHAAYPIVYFPVLVGTFFTLRFCLIATRRKIAELFTLAAGGVSFRENNQITPEKFTET